MKTLCHPSVTVLSLRNPTDVSYLKTWMNVYCLCKGEYPIIVSCKSPCGLKMSVKLMCGTVLYIPCRVFSLFCQTVVYSHEICMSFFFIIHKISAKWGGRDSPPLIYLGNDSDHSMKCGGESPH